MHSRNNLDVFRGGRMIARGRAAGEIIAKIEIVVANSLVFRAWRTFRSIGTVVRNIARQRQKRPKSIVSHKKRNKYIYFDSRVISFLVDYHVSG